MQFPKPRDGHDQPDCLLGTLVSYANGGSDPGYRTRPGLDLGMTKMNIAREIADAINTDTFGVSNRDETYRKIKSAILDAKAEAYEEAAKVASARFTEDNVPKNAKGHPYSSGNVAIYAALEIAAAIRKLGNPS